MGSDALACSVLARFLVGFQERNAEIHYTAANAEFDHREHSTAVPMLGGQQLFIILGSVLRDNANSGSRQAKLRLSASVAALNLVDGRIWS
jgi:hypothetical protein